MNQKIAFLFAGILTAFLLVIGGGLAGRLSQSSAAPAPAPTAAPADAAPVAQIDPSAQLIAQMQQREAAYQQLIDQANQRLQAAYAQQQATVAQINQARSAAPARSAQPAQTQAPAAAAAAQPAAPSLSPEAAINIAINASNGKRMTREPQLVLFENQVAYEIGFTNGAIYIDANSGAVLYNGTVGHVASSGSNSTPPSTQGTEDNNGEHDD